MVVCWLGAALRYHGLFANSFHPDEALFATWARLIAVWRDPLLITQAVDKPPLLFYLQALFYPFFGPVEWAARMPSFIVSLLLIPLTAQLTRRLTGDRTAALIAALIVAVAPLTVQFSATAFSDPLLTFWIMAALYSAARPHRLAANSRTGSALTGILFGLALATKYQALLFFPLILVIGWLNDYRRVDWLRYLAGFAVVAALVLAWQWVRPDAGLPVNLQWANIGGIRPAYSWELWSRFVDTAHLWRLAMGWPLIAAGAIAGVIYLLPGCKTIRSLPTEWIIGLFLLGYSVIHWLWAVPVWDRYLLPVFPLAAMLIGRVLSTAYRSTTDRPLLRRALALALGLIIIASLPIAVGARAGRFPIGGQPGADGGAGGAANLLKDAPYGTVLYDHWYSWHWRYQLFDSRVYVSWFPHADALLNDLSAFGQSGPVRFIALPSSGAAAPIVRRLAERGYRLEPLVGQDDTAGMTIYRIITTEKPG